MAHVVNPYTNKLNLGDGVMFVGKDSPQVATTLAQLKTVAVWSVASGGRMGKLLGKDAAD